MLVVWIGLDTSLGGSIWSGMRISQSAITVEYCEFNQVNRFFHQPVNTYSNLAYFFFGIFLVGIAGEDARNRGKPGQNQLENFPMLSALLGACMVYLSVGSAFFHASLTYAGQRVDMNGTYAVLLSLVGIALYHVLPGLRLTPLQKTGWVLSVVGLVVVFLQVALWLSSARLVPALLLLLNGLMLLNYGQFRKERSLGVALLSLVLIVIAIRIRTLDVQKVDCDPHSLLQGHAVWHGLTALSTFCSYSFFRFTGRILR
ncbi:hypothetical protein GCM10027190_62330 [Spirosoma areae]